MIKGSIREKSVIGSCCDEYFFTNFFSFILFFFMPFLNLLFPLFRAHFSVSSCVGLSGSRKKKQKENKQKKKEKMLIEDRKIMIIHYYELLKNEKKYM